eukprot:895305_1
MNASSIIDSRSRTKPNTPDNDPDFLSVFPAPKDLVKSRSLDSKKQMMASIASKQRRIFVDISYAEVNNNPLSETQFSYDSNCMIISGNVSGRSLADSGNFTKCICDSFGSNVTKLIKADFNALVVEIGQTLEQRTNHAELCNINGTLRFNKIRFEKCNGR